MAREYFKAFHSYLTSIEPLNDAERGRLFTAMLTYSITGEVPELRGNERFIFPTMKVNIDREVESYQSAVKTNQANGAKGGRPKKTEKTDSVFEKPKETEKSQEKEKEEDKDKEKEYILSSLSRESKETHSLKKMGGSLGEHRVVISDAQFNDLLERLSIDEIHHYFEVIKECEDNGKHFGKSHYKAILDMAEQDRKLCATT
jgi:hypothetical protein